MGIEITGRSEADTISSEKPEVPRLVSARGRGDAGYARLVGETGRLVGLLGVMSGCRRIGDNKSWSTLSD